MKRLIPAFLAALVVASAVPSTALARPPAMGVLDQSNTVFSAGYTNEEGLGQTFTAGKTGMLTGVKLYMKGGGGFVSPGFCDAPLEWCTGFSDGGTPAPEYGWMQFDFAYPQPIVAGSHYSLVFYMIDLGAAGGAGYSNTDTYAGGEAKVHNPKTQTWESSPSIRDFMFQTIVEQQTATLAWDKPQIPAGQTTQLTLTETFFFPAFYGIQPSAAGVPNLRAYDGTYAINAHTLPAWFAPSQVTCSAQIAAADCTLAKTTGSGSVALVQDGKPVTITLTGAATPSATATTGTAQARACAVYRQGAPLCVEGAAVVGIVGLATPTARITLPPTSSRAPGGDSGVPNALVLLMLSLAAMGTFAAVALGRRRTR